MIALSMRARHGMLLALLLAVLGPAVPFAQAQEARVITFNEAVRLALERNTTLRQAAATVEQRNVEIERARATFYPSLSVTSNASQSYGRVVDPNDFRVVNQTSEFISADLGTQVNVFNGFRDVAQLKLSRLNEDVASLSYDRARQNTVFRVVATYLDLVEQQEQIRIQQESLTAQQQQLAQIQEFVNVGTRPVSDLYRQEAEVARTELALLNAERAYRLSEGQLIQLLQLDPFGNYRFQTPTVDEAQLRDEAYDLGALLRTAFDQRVDLDARTMALTAAEQSVRLARLSMMPTVNFRAGYGSDWASIRNGSFFEQFDDRRGGSMAFSISVPIFDRFQTRNSVALARVQRQQAQIDLDATRQSVAVEVRQAYLDFQAAEKQLDVAAKQERAAQQALDAAQERYNVGAGTIVELTQARADYVRAASERVNARYNYVFQQKLIDYYAGTLDPGEPLF